MRISLIFISKFTHFQFFNQDSFFVKEILGLFGKNKQENKIEDCKKIALILKNLIRIDSLTCIILNFLSDENFKEFFESFKFLPENENSTVDFPILLIRANNFNNLFEIKDQKILKLIHMNNRIVIFRDFLYSNILAENQIDELNLAIISNNNNILGFLTMTLESKFSRITNLMVEKTKEADYFFTEIFSILKNSNELKRSAFFKEFFTKNLSLKIVEVFFESAKNKNTKLTLLCLDILGFFLFNNPSFLVELLNFREKITQKNFLDMIPLFFEKKIDFFLVSSFLSLFEIPYMCYISNDYLNMIEKQVLPYFLEHLEKIIETGELNSQILFFKFVAELHLNLFKSKREHLIKSVMDNSLLFVYPIIFKLNHQKYFSLSFLEYLAYLLRFLKETETKKENKFEQIFDLFFKIYKKSLKRKHSLFYSLCLFIFQIIFQSKIVLILQQFWKSLLKFEIDFSDEEILIKIESKIRLFNNMPIQQSDFNGPLKNFIQKIEPDSFSDFVLNIKEKSIEINDFKMDDFLAVKNEKFICKNVKANTSGKQELQNIFFEMQRNKKKNDVLVLPEKKLINSNKSNVQKLETVSSYENLLVKREEFLDFK